jgi:DNA-binding NtrC family response regulator
MARLTAYPWPGNVSAVEHAVVVARDRFVDAGDLPDVIGSPDTRHLPKAPGARSLPGRRTG